MKYMGSKRRIAKHILPIILKDRKPNQYYVEPFMGGCNSLCEVDGLRIGNDYNEYLVELWKGIINNNDLIYDIPKELFDKGRHQFNNRHDYGLSKFEIGWIGFMAGFNGRFYGGGYSGKHKNRDYVKEQINNTLKQVEKLKGVEFYSCSYNELNIPKNSIIYCDPPYKDTKQYDVKDKFNHEEFYDWCRYMKEQGHTIFISEYNMPSDFICVWEMEVKVSIRPTKTIKQIEKLFTL